MSQYPSMPPPGQYVPPNQIQQLPGSPPQQQPHYEYQQLQAPSPYGAQSQAYNPSGSQKPTKALGQVFNQAVTQGKPMLDKLGKSISSKLNRQPKQPVYNPQSTPQNSYQTYQQQHQYGQPQGQQFQQTSPQGYSSQGQPFSPGGQSIYQTPQQSPYPQSNYATPGAGTPGQGNNYFPQQAPPIPNQQTPQSQQAPPTPHQQSPQFQQTQQHSAYSPNGSPGVGTNHTGHSHTQSHQSGHLQNGQLHQPQPQSLPSQTQFGQASGQQVGVIGGATPQSQPQQNFEQQSTPVSGSVQEQQQYQQQWAPPAPVNHQHAPFTPQSPVGPAGGLQQQQTWTPHQQPSPVSQSPVHVQATPSPQQHNAAPPVPAHPNKVQAQQPPQSPQQQWAPVTNPSPQPQQVQPAASEPSPHVQASEVHKPTTPVAIPSEQQQLSHKEPLQQKPTPSPAPSSPSKSSPIGFIAELPADLGGLSLEEGPKTEQAQVQASQAAPYRAYRPTLAQHASSGSGYTIARRAVSTSSLPLADPWRIADPVTELPTREFYLLADLIFDSMDRKYEPQNTGLLEASKVLESWKAQELPREAADIFAHDSCSAFGKIWGLQGVPHVLVPCQPSLIPTWNFQQQIHSPELKLQEESTLASASYPTYMPALNRAGWYKYSFLNWLHQPEELEKTLSALCADTYNPGILNQPDLQKRDKNESPSLVARATAISTTAISRVCQEVVAQMQGSSRGNKQGGSVRDAAQGSAQAQ